MKQHNPNPAAQASELWQIVLKFKWAVLLVGVALSALAIVIIGLLPDHFEATTTVLVDTQKIPEKYVSATVASDPLRLNLLSQEVLSTSRLDQIIDRSELFADARKTLPREQIIAGMRKNIKIEATPSGDRSLNYFTITYKNGNAQKVALVANQLAASFIEWSLAQREHQTAETTEFLAAELQDAKKTIDEQEEKLNSYKTQHLGELPEQLQANSEALTRLQVALQANADALNRLDQEKAMLEQAPESIRTQPKSAADANRMLLEEQQQKLKESIAELRTRYSDEHPDLQQAKNHLMAVERQLQDLPLATSSIAPGSVSNVRLGIIAKEMNRLQEAQKHLLGQISQYQARIEATPLREQAIAELSREYQVSKEHYQSTLDKTYSAGLAKDLESNRAGQFFTIIDPAHAPEAPSSPHRLPMFLAAIPFCFLLSTGLVTVFERMRGAVSSERQLRFLLPNTACILGSIPVIETPQSVRRQRQMAALSISGSIVCILTVAIFLWRCHPYL